MKEYIPSLLKALAQLGYIEGRNLAIDWRFCDMDLAGGAPLAAELVRPGVDVLHSNSTPQTKDLLEVTKTIPIVTNVADPVASGFSRTLARPGGNVTGLSLTHPDTPAKQVEMIRMVVPELKRLVIISDIRYGMSRQLVGPQEVAASAVGLVADVKLVDPSGFDRVFGEMRRLGARAAYIALFMDIDMGEVARLAIRHGVATLYYYRGYAERGGLMSFNMFHAGFFQRTASIMDKVFRGMNPAEIPWELPDRSHLAINLRTARTLGLTVPSELLVRADQVIE